MDKTMSTVIRAEWETESGIMESKCTRLLPLTSSVGSLVVRAGVTFN